MVLWLTYAHNDCQIGSNKWIILHTCRVLLQQTKRFKRRWRSVCVILDYRTCHVLFWVSRPALRSRDYLDSAKRLKHKADDTVSNSLLPSVCLSVHLSVWVCLQQHCALKVEFFSAPYLPFLDEIFTAREYSDNFRQAKKVRGHL